MVDRRENHEQEALPVTAPQLERLNFILAMVRLLRSPALRRLKVVGIVWMAGGWGLATAFAQPQPPVHYPHAGALPPGAIGSQQLMRGGPLPGYFQPVEIRVPQGAAVSLAVEGEFQPPSQVPLGAGMLIGAVYRLRVTEMPNHIGQELYPTIEVIDRTYPPVGQERRFPIPIELDQEELDLALDGRFVTRVIYLEDPLDALPIAEDAKRQFNFQAAPGEDPLEVADRLGRPVAILRIGGRVPESDQPDAAFLYGSPPWIPFRPVPLEQETLHDFDGRHSVPGQPAIERVTLGPPRRKKNNPGVMRASANLPRQPLGSAIVRGAHAGESSRRGQK